MYIPLIYRYEKIIRIFNIHILVHSVSIYLLFECLKCLNVHKKNIIVQIIL